MKAAVVVQPVSYAKIIKPLSSCSTSASIYPPFSQCKSSVIAYNSAKILGFSRLNIQCVNIIKPLFSVSKKVGVVYAASESETSTASKVTQGWLLEPVGDGDWKHIGSKVALPGAYEIFSSEMVVGRASEKADLVIPVATVSGAHARIQNKEGSLFITDLDSTNGTYINEKRVPPGATEVVPPGSLLTFVFSKSKLLPETVKAMDKSSLEYTMMLAELTAGEMNIPPPPPNPRQAPVAMNAPVHDQGEQANADANAGDDPFGDNEPIEPSMFDERQGEEAPQADEQALDYADSDDANDEDDDDDDDDDEDDQLPRDDALVGDHESHSPEGAQPQLENSPASPDPDVTLYPKLSMRQKEKRVSRAMKNVLTPYEEKTYRSEGSPMIDAARDLWIEFSGRFEAINRELDETMKQYNDMLVDLKKVEKLLDDEKAAHGVLKNSVETLKKGHKDEVDALNQKLKDSATRVEDLERDLKAAKDSVEASNQAAESSKQKLSDALLEKEKLENQLKEGAANWFEQWKQSQAGQVYTGNIANQAKAKSVAALHEKYKTALGALIPEKAEEIMAAVQQEIDRERKAMMEAVRKQLQADQEAAAAAALKKQQDALAEAAELKKAEAEKKGEAVYEKRSKKRNDKGQAKTPEGVADPGNPEGVHHQSAPEGESKRQKTSHSSKSKQSSHASGVSQARHK